MNKMLWITGIEDTFIARTDKTSPRRLDEYELTQHYYHWKEDLDIIRNTGFRLLRYGIPWYLVNPEAGKFDWRWVDQVMAYMENIGISPIIDFFHYGTPLWLENSFLNHAFPERMTEYIMSFFERYGDFVKYYTPMNEPYITQEFCGRNAVWPPYLSGYDGFCKILKNTAKGIVKSVSAVKESYPEVFALHVEASGIFFGETQRETAKAKFEDELRFATYDLIQGKITEDHFLYNFLRKNGFSANDIIWFHDNAINIDGFGVNYYPQLSVYKIEEKRNKYHYTSYYGGTEYLGNLLRKYSKRYKGPIFLTETSVNGEVNEQINWWKASTSFLDELISQEGLNIQGYTWFPALDLINWDYRYGNRPVEDYLEPMGFVKLVMNSSRIFERHPTKLAKTIHDDINE
jgi:beta-glucosidase/6-phospho-beta-glucosidase/beta-galactosidase